MNSVRLSLGSVYYDLGGTENGPVVVLIHGFSVPSFIWDPTFNSLGEAGFRVLRYDLYGRGFSDKPKVVYNLQLFEQQLLGLLEAMKIQEKVNLVGLSMGGMIAAHFTDQHPALVRKVSLIDPAGFPIKLSFLNKIFAIPRVGEILMNLLGEGVLASGCRDDFYRKEKFTSEFRSKYCAQMKDRGFKHAIFSTLRHMPLGDMEETYHRVGKHGLPVQLFWGREDKLIPISNSQKLIAAIPHLEFFAIDHAGHIPHFERPEVVNPILINFLSSP